MPNFYESLAKLDYQLLRLKRFSDQAARDADLGSLPAQLLLALRGLPKDRQPTIREMAERLQVQHHTAVEAANCLVVRGFLARNRGKRDRRTVLLRITPAGKAVVRKLVRLTSRELRKESGASLVRTITEARRGGTRHNSLLRS